MNAAKKEHDSLTRWWGAREAGGFFLSQFKRYTLFVIYGKWSLLGFALILVAALVIWPFVGKDKSGLRISFVDSKSVTAPPDKPVMNSPEYRGNSANGREYKVTGTRATQETQDMIIIDQVEAVVMKPDGGWQMLSADKAEYYKGAQRIELIGNVVTTDNRNNQFTTTRANVNTATMDVASKEPVEGIGDSGKVVASGFEMRDKGNHITFYRGAEQVKVVANQAKRRP